MCRKGVLYSVSRKTWSVFFSCLSLFALIPAAPAADVTLAWDASPDTTVVGYRVYYGSVSGNYTNFIQVGNVTTATVTNLRAGNRYYFAATANDSDDLESPFSNEVGYTVPSVNQVPTLGAIGNVTIDEDAGLQTVGLSGISAGSGETGQPLTVSAVSSNPGLVPHPEVSYTSPNGTGSLRFTPVADGHGSAVITVTVNDGQGTNNTVSRNFTVTVRSVNDAPTLDAIANRSLTGDGGAQTVGLSGISSGAADEADVLTVSAVSSDPSLVSHPVVSYTSPNGTGSLRLEPAANRNGSAVITVTVNDGQAQNGTVSRSFTVTVNAVNQVPTLGAIGNVTIDEDAGLQTVGLSGISAGSGETGQPLTVSAVSSNPGLVPHPEVSYTSPNGTGSLRFTPVADGHGSAVITVTVNDGQGTNNTVSRNFTVTVRSVNDAPTLDAIANRSLTGDGGAQTVGLSGISSGAADEADVLTVSAVSSDPSLVSHPVVSYTSPNGTGSLRLEPAANRNGSAVITVTVNDGQAQNGTVSRSFTVTVNAVNQVPTISTITDRTIISDTNSGLIGFVISDEDTPVNSLTLTASSSAPSIVPVAGIVFGGSGTNRTVRITPVPDSAGTARITLTVSDGTAAASTAFNVIVQKPQPAVGQLSVVKNGEGTITPDLTGMTLIVGQSYTVTAVPASGYVFSSWSGSVVSTSSTLTFIMQSNTVIQANFVGDPYLAAAGTYNGLFNETDEVRLESAGTFSVYVDNQGHYSAWVQMGYVRYPFSGALSQELRATNTIARWEQSSLVVELEVGRGATAGQIFGRITDGRWTGQLSGGRPASSSDLAGEYTAVFPGIAGDLSRPAGDGYATIHVAADGLATMSGTLADGTRFMQSAYITVDGDWPLGVSMYAGKGLILSWVTFANLASSDLNGDMVWIKQAGASATSYPLGFALGTKVVGSAYVAPQAGEKALNLTGGVVRFSGGNLTAPFNNVVSINPGSQVVNLSPNTLAFNITPSSGLFSGQVQEPDGGSTHVFNGVILQKLNAGYGTMDGSPLASRVVLAAP